MTDSAAANRLPVSPREASQSFTIVTHQQLDEPNLQSMRDVLDNSSGVYSYAYDSERVVFTSRGFFTDNLMVDGVPAAGNLVRKHADSRSLSADLNLSYGSWNDTRASADVSSKLNASGSIRARAIARVPVPRELPEPL